MCTRYCDGPALLLIASVILLHLMTVRGLGEGDDEIDLALNLVLSCLHTQTCICIPPSDILCTLHNNAIFNFV